MTWAIDMLSNLNALGARLTNIWVCDTEFYGADGNLQHPVCAVFHSPVTGDTSASSFHLNRRVRRVVLT